MRQAKRVAKLMQQRGVRILLTQAKPALPAGDLLLHIIGQGDGVAATRPALMLCDA